MSVQSHAFCKIILILTGTATFTQFSILAFLLNEHLFRYTAKSIIVQNFSVSGPSTKLVLL